ncbi:unnamed protein product, partial [Prorocentrum cordatum]
PPPQPAPPAPPPASRTRSADQRDRSRTPQPPTRPGGGAEEVRGMAAVLEDHQSKQDGWNRQEWGGDRQEWGGGRRWSGSGEQRAGGGRFEGGGGLGWRARQPAAGDRWGSGFPRDRSASPSAAASSASGAGRSRDGRWGGGGDRGRQDWGRGGQQQRSSFQRGWGHQSQRCTPFVSAKKWLKREKAPSEFFCNVCNKDLKRRERYEEHIKEDHIPCTEPGCTFSGPEHSMAAHRLSHSKAADGKSVLESPEEIKAWIAGRRANFPSKANAEKKALQEERRMMSGALMDEDARPKPGMIEKLLRKQSMDSGGDYGKGWDKGWSKGKKGKGKGKFMDKGKGKDKGKKGKKGKGKGKDKGYSYRPAVFEGDSWGSALAGLPPPAEHALVSVPMPSMLANCVPLEAPFGHVAPPPALAPTRRAGSKGVCKYFEKGFCFHGDRCQYDHGPGLPALPMLMDAGASTAAAAAEQAARVPWWALASTLANRACRPGEGPAGTVGSAQAGAQGVRATRVPGCHPPGSRQRRDGLLRRLLKADVDGRGSQTCMGTGTAESRMFLEARFFLPQGLPQMHGHARPAASWPRASGPATVAPPCPLVGTYRGRPVCWGGLPEVASGAAAVLQELGVEPMEAVQVASGAAAVLQELGVEPMEVDEDLDDADIAELADVLV